MWRPRSDGAPKLKVGFISPVMHSAPPANLYLHNTVVHLEKRGIHDRNLWHLQSLVAEHIKAATSSPGPEPKSLFPCPRFV
jgi:cation transport regulator ChaC